ncbi:MAG: hypothetical protein V3T05_11560 [Myxococcota bacterium]
MAEDTKDRWYVVCLTSGEYRASLEPRKIYISLARRDSDHADMIRVIDESGEDYLYPRSMFAEIEVPRELEGAFQLESA